MHFLAYNFLVPPFFKATHKRLSLSSIGMFTKKVQIIYISKKEARGAGEMAQA